MSKLKYLYLGTNTKMYKTIRDTTDYLTELKQLTADLKDAPLRLFVIPSYTSLESVGKLLENSHISLGAQNMCWEETGEFTGEISPLMLAETGVSIVEIGHSERRHKLKETDADQEKKTASAVSHGFTPLLCVGETKEQKDYGISDETLMIQLKIGLHSMQPTETKHLMIAYEPVWAIGAAGTPAKSDYIEKRHHTIRAALVSLFGEEAGRQIPILYGGSVNQENSSEMIKLPDVDGLFIGRSAWDAGRFNEIIRQVLPIYLTK